MSLSNLSAVIITRNVATTIRDTLDSLRSFDEVLIYDNGSDDGTQEIVREYANVTLHCGDFFGFGKTKAHAVSLARNDWVFSIDADETLSDTLRKSLDDLSLSDSSIAYYILRDNYLMGKHVRYAGWGSDWLLRLFNRDKHGFNDALVHEQVVLSAGASTRRLSGSLRHNAVQELGQFLVKINRYTEFNREPGTRIHALPIIIVKTWFSFFRSYVLQRGFLDGWRGYVVARCNADGTFFKYMKPLADSNVIAEQKARRDG